MPSLTWPQGNHADWLNTQDTRCTNIVADGVEIHTFTFTAVEIQMDSNADIAISGWEIASPNVANALA